MDNKEPLLLAPSWAAAAKLINMAQQYAPFAAMRSSAELCISDAIRLNNENKYEDAMTHALKSLKYSVDILSPAYQIALKIIGGSFAYDVLNGREEVKLH